MRLLVRCIAAAILVGSSGCSGNGTSNDSGNVTAGDNESSGDSGGGKANGGSGDTPDPRDAGSDVTGGAPVPGASAEGWKSAYVEGGKGSNCNQTQVEMTAANLPSLTFGESTLFVGFEQVGQNQNPIFARFDSGKKVYCEHHESEGPDGRAVGLTWDGGEVAYVVYTIVGGGSSLEGKSGWLPSYAPGAISGGGPKVSVVGKVNVIHGELERATFVIAIKSDNKVNSHGPAGPVTVLKNGSVEFFGGSAHKPIDADGKSAMNCTDYPFESHYVFEQDLSKLVCAECSNCKSQRPCE